MISGARTRPLLQPISTDRNPATVLKAHQPLADILDLEPLLPITLNTVECLDSKDLNQPDRCLNSNRQANSLVNNKDMVVPQPNHLLNTAINSRWAMVVLPALVAMAVELNKPQTLNGVRLLAKTSTTALVAILNDSNGLLSARQISWACTARSVGFLKDAGYEFRKSRFSLFTFVLCSGFPLSAATPLFNLHETVLSFQGLTFSITSFPLI